MQFTEHFHVEQQKESVGGVQGEEEEESEDKLSLFQPWLSYKKITCQVIMFGWFGRNCVKYRSV